MKKRLIFVGCLLVAAVGCATLTRPSGSVQLPPGDAERGKAAFLELRCNYCHRVDGVEMSAPVVPPPVPVMLGDRAKPVRTREYLAQSIIAPSHEFARGYKEDLIREGKLSRMGDYSDVLTVRQLTDVVAFLQSVREQKEE